MTERAVYNDEQLSCYFDRIHLPTSSRHFTVTSLAPSTQLEVLTNLQKHQLLHVPFENLALHYSWHRVIDLDPEHLFHKIVRASGRGGYCMENNKLFHVILRSLGYSAYMVGARPYEIAASQYGGFTHCLNIVVINGIRYAIDVCFGSRVPVLPLQLHEGQVQPHSHPAQMRVRYDCIPQALCSDQKVWIYEHRKNEKAEWIPQYCFVEFEFLPDDINSINWAPARSPSSFFTQRVVCVKFTAENEVYTPAYIESGDYDGVKREETTPGLIDGALILDGNLFKWRKNGVKQWEVELKAETQRVNVLLRYFGISLSGPDVRAIRGSTAEITQVAGPSLH